MGQVVHVVFNTVPASDPGGAIQKRIREGIYNRSSRLKGFTKVVLRDSVNAQITSWLMGQRDRQRQPGARSLSLSMHAGSDVSVSNDVVTLNDLTPGP